MATPTIFTVKNVDAAQLAAATGTLLTVASNTNGIQITSIKLVNDTTTPTNATIYLVPSGGSAADTNILCKNFAVPGDGTPYELIAPGVPVFLESAGLIRGVADTADVITYHISYVEFD